MRAFMRLVIHDGYAEDAHLELAPEYKRMAQLAGVDRDRSKKNLANYKRWTRHLNDEDVFIREMGNWFEYPKRFEKELRDMGVRALDQMVRAFPQRTVDPMRELFALKRHLLPGHASKRFVEATEQRITQLAFFERVLEKMPRFLEDVGAEAHLIRHAAKLYEYHSSLNLAIRAFQRLNPIDRMNRVRIWRENYEQPPAYPGQKKPRVRKNRPPRPPKPPYPHGH